MKWFVISFLFLLSGWGNAISLEAQSSLRFQSFTQQDGLSNNAVRFIQQDEYGFIWLGTDNGLNRFDGQQFQQFRCDPKDQKTISANGIGTLYLDREQTLWIGTNSGLNRLNKHEGTFDRIDLAPNEPASIAYSIRSIYQDRENNYWIGTLSNGLLKLSPGIHKDSFTIEQFKHNPKLPGSISAGEIKGIYEDEKGYLWLIHPLAVDRFDPRTGNVLHLAVPDLGEQEVEMGIMRSYQDQEGIILLVFFRLGIYYFDPSADRPAVQAYRFPTQLGLPTPEEVGYRRILIDQENRFWLGTDHGVTIINADRTASTQLSAKADEAGQLQDAKIRVFFQGKDGSIWIGTRSRGLFREKITTDPYFFHQHEPADPNSIAPHPVRTICSDERGHIWLGYLGAGVEEFMLNENQQLVKLRSFRHENDQENTLLDNDIIQIFKDRSGFLWIGTNGHGLNKLDPETGKIDAFITDPNDPETLSGNRIWGICQDRLGYIWVADFLHGVNRLDPKTGKVKRFQHEPGNPNSLSFDRVKSIMMDRDGMIWIGTNVGLNRFDPTTEQFTRFFHDPSDPGSLSSSHIFSIFEDEENNLWFGTTLGLNKLSAANRKEHTSKYRFERFYESDGLPSNMIYGIQGDHLGNIWVGTDEGLVRLRITNPYQSIVKINYEEALEYGVFLPKSHYFDPQTEQVLLGTREGLLITRPKRTEDHKALSEIVLSSVSTYQLAGKEGSLMVDYFAYNRKRIELTHRDQVVTFDLSELNWDENSIYEYQFTGFSNQWVRLGPEMDITFTNLSPGAYTLKARKKNTDQRPAQEIQLMDVIVYPPWWKSGWAYLSYVLIALGLIFLLYRFQLRRALEKQERLQLKELDEAKTKFFTNISHEFRTPLTIISGMIDQVKSKPDIWLDKGTKVIKQNTLSLLHLINQILDLRKLESKQLTVNLMQGDIVQYLRYLKESYQSYAENEGLELHFESTQPSLVMDYDPDKMLRIISNLLSNAIKYNQAGGQIFFRLKKIDKNDASEWLRIEVQDTGAGIPPEKLPNIFTRFYQINEPGEQKVIGSGIGLALVYELVKMMKGEIAVTSEPGIGTSFTLHLPIHRAAEQSSAYIPQIEEGMLAPPVNSRQAILSEEATMGFTDRPRLLIVEDNPQIVQILIACLEEHYQLDIASNGRIGIEKAIAEVPDLIISDVMMPEKDGYELTDTLKNDERTDHIPIILLTAKSDIDSKISGLEKGADAYLAKPFEQRELLIRLQKLLELRQKLQARYAGITQEEGPVTIEDPFLQKFYSLVEDQLSNTDLDMHQLCRILGMSRSQVFRKMKALTGKPPTIFIRSIRLQKGRRLLATTQLTVSEIAYDVGFSSPSYFSRAFQEEYGLSPSSYRN